MEDLFTGFSFTTGVVRYKDLGYLLATKDSLVEKKVPHSRLLTRDQGNWGGWNLDWLAASGTVCHAPAERFITVGQLGAVWVVGGGQSQEEPPVGKGAEFKKRGYLREVRGIAKGRAYAVGTCRQAYRRDGPGAWVCIDNWAKSKAKDITDYSFESIDGFSEKDIYVAGWEGEIWHYDGKKWTQIESPTNLALHKVVCAGDGNVYIAGQVGTLIRGRGDQWDVINHEATEEDFWGLAWFQDELYLATTHFVYRLVDDQLVRIDFGDTDIPATCYHLSAADGIMWSIGAKDVMEFNGSAWTRIV